MELEQYLGPLNKEIESEASKSDKGSIGLIKRKMKRQEVLKESLGIDVSKDSLSYCLGTLNGDLSKTFIQGTDVVNDPSGFKKLDIWLRKHHVQSDCLSIVMESTGVYHEGIAGYLFQKGYKVSILQSGRVKRYAQSLDQRSKTDALDSRMLSMLGCERQLTAWEPPSDHLQKLRSLSRERSCLVKERSLELNRAHALNHGVYKDIQTEKRYQQRMELLQVQIGEIEFEMQSVIRADEALSEKMGYMVSIPGVSFISAATVLAETLGFSTISSAKQLTSYAGYDVVLRESGNYKGKTHISKKGNKHIRAVLHMPSMTAVRLNPSLKPFYERLKPRKDKPLIALIAVQRKLLVLMFSLYKKNEYYDPKYEIKKRQKLKALAAQDSSNINITAS